MGYYVNPICTSKEAWLEANGVEINPETALPVFNFQGLSLPVCLVDNGHFLAAICYSPEEARAFSLPNDERPKRWFNVPKVALEPWYKE